MCVSGRTRNQISNKVKEHFNYQKESPKVETGQGTLILPASKKCGQSVIFTIARLIHPDYYSPRPTLWNVIFIGLEFLQILKPT